MLEEGEKDDWFGSKFIIRMAIVSGVALVSFVIVQFTGARLRCCTCGSWRDATSALSSIANFFFGFSMYGWLYIVPVYLARVQGYDAEQIGEVLIWIGVPQLLILPLVPKIMSRFDPRRMATVGLSAVHSWQPARFASVGRLLRAAVHLLQPRTGGGSGPGDDAALRHRRRRNRA